MSGYPQSVFAAIKFLIPLRKIGWAKFSINRQKETSSHTQNNKTSSSNSVNLAKSKNLLFFAWAYISGLSEGWICQIKGFCYRDVKFLGSIGHHIDQLGDHIDQLGDRIAQLGDRIDQLGDHIDQLGDRIDQVANRIDQVADHMDQVADHIDQVADRIDQVADRIDQVADHINQSRSLSTHQNGSFKPAVAFLNLRKLWLISILMFSKSSNRPKNSFFIPIISSKKYGIKIVKDFRNFAIYWHFTVGGPEIVGLTLAPKNQGIKFWFEK